MFNQTSQHRPPGQAAGRSALLFIMVTVFLDMLGTGLLLPVLPFVVRPYRNDALTVGLLALAYSAAQFLACPVLGWLSDRYGRRPVLLLSVLGTALGYLVFGLAGALWVLFVARIIDGITGGNISTAEAYIADVTPQEARARNYGLMGAVVALGFIIGPALGGLLGQISLNAPAFLAATLGLLSLVFGVFVLPESLPPERRQSGPPLLHQLNPLGSVIEHLRDKKLRPILLALFGLNFTISGLQTNFALFASVRFGLGPADTALIFTFLGVLGVLIQVFAVGRLVPRFGDKWLAIAGLAVTVLGCALTAATPGKDWLYLALGITCIGSGLATPTLTSLISGMAGVHERGRVMGVTHAINSLSRVVGPVWAGALFDLMGSGAPYWSMALLLGLTIPLVFGARDLTASLPSQQESPVL